jgi:hypothetical protein
MGEKIKKQVNKILFCISSIPLGNHFKKTYGTLAMLAKTYVNVYHFSGSKSNP